MLRLLLVDDSIVDHDPGDFPDPDADARGTEWDSDWENGDFETGAHVGLMGYYIRDLEGVGFEVITATGAEEALGLLRRTGKFDVIVLDAMMPYLASGVYDQAGTAGGIRTGFILAEEIHRREPDVPIWILSQIVPVEGSPVNKATVDDLLSRGVVVGVVCKLDCDPVDFARRVHDFLESD